MAPEKEIKIILRSSFEEMEKLEPFLSKLQEWPAVDQELADRIMLPLSEAVNNAILHGNQLHQEKSVVVAARLYEQHVRISVEDEGKGFDPNNIPDPLKEENLLKEGGRGIFLIREYADDLFFAKNGSKITMHFSL